MRSAAPPLGFIELTESSSADEPEALPAAGAPRILVVDDETEVSGLLHEFFSTRGFAVILAGGGREALARIERDAPDMVLLDVRMPDFDGLEVLKKIREAGPTPAVLMMSGNDDLEAARRSIDLGAVDYVLKPFDLDHIERVVRKQLSELSPMPAEAAVPAFSLPAPSPHGLLYDLALEMFRATRTFPAETRGALGDTLESMALTMMQRGHASDKTELVQSLYQLRMLTRFARDLGDLTDDRHRVLEAHLVRARRANGLT